MPFSDYHIHTLYCDGASTPEEIIERAIDLGVETIGFSGHSYVDFDECCMSLENTKKYILDIKKLKNKYKNKINIYLGIELDYYSDFDTSDFDYIIGSVHYVKKGDKYLSIDENKDKFINIIDEYFSSDPYSFAEEYYKTLSNLYKKTKCDIVGHFDLITKFNENNEFFDTKNLRYITAWKSAVDALINNNLLFEINSGAISRGYRTDYYPERDIRTYIKKNNGNFILSSDSHSKDTICFHFNEMSSIVNSEKLNLKELFS